MGLGYARLRGWGISFYLFALPSPTGRGVGGEGSLRKGALLRAINAPQRALKQCACKALTPAPSPKGRGESLNMYPTNPSTYRSTPVGEGLLHS
jgi:hypothetical protein